MTINRETARKQPSRTRARPRRLDAAALAEAKKLLREIFLETLFEPWLRTPAGAKLLHEAYSYNVHFRQYEAHAKRSYHKAKER
jgi:hypothetical protein